jgi:hypothetical protein
MFSNRPTILLKPYNAVSPASFLINDIAAKLDYDSCDLDDMSEVPDFEMIKKTVFKTTLH